MLYARKILVQKRSVDPFVAHLAFWLRLREGGPKVNFIVVRFSVTSSRVRVCHGCMQVLQQHYNCCKTLMVYFASRLPDFKFLCSRRAAAWSPGCSPASQGVSEANLWIVMQANRHNYCLAGWHGNAMHSHLVYASFSFLANSNRTIEIPGKQVYNEYKTTKENTYICMYLKMKG